MRPEDALDMHLRQWERAYEEIAEVEKSYLRWLEAVQDEVGEGLGTCSLCGASPVFITRDGWCKDCEEFKEKEGGV